MIVVIKKLVITKSGSHYFRKVSRLKNRGLYWTESEDEINVFHDKRQLDDFGQLCDAIKREKDAYLRDIKIEEVLK